MRASYGGDLRRMPRRRQPVVDRSANAPAPDRRLTWSVMAGNEKDDALAAGNCKLEAAIDRCPCAVEVHAMKIKDPVRFDRPAPQSLVPSSIKRPFTNWRGLARWL